MQNVFQRVPMFTLALMCLGVLLPGCCDDNVGSTASDSDSVYDDVGETPQGSHVVGAAIFSGGGGVLIDLSVIDLEEPEHTPIAEITAWVGSRDTTDSGDELPDLATPPTTEPLASTSIWNLRSPNGGMHAWAPGQLDAKHDTAKDQLWVYVEVLLNRDDGNTPRGRFVFRHEWSSSSNDTHRMAFTKL